MHLQQQRLLAEVAEVPRVMDKALHRMREKLLAIPDRVAPQRGSLSEPEMLELLEREVLDGLEAFAVTRL